VNLEDLGVDERLVFRMNVREIGCEGVDWIYHAQVRDQWPAFLNMVMNLWSSIKIVEFLVQLSDCKSLKKNSAAMGSVNLAIVLSCNSGDEGLDTPER
jgi:hypothetical protein